MYQELIQFFGKTGTKYFGKHLTSLKALLEKSNLPMVYETYVGQLFFFSFISLNLFLVYFLYLFLVFWNIRYGLAILVSSTLTLAVTILIATVFYMYPFFKNEKQRVDIEQNMPFGISYMNIISKSGAPLQKTLEQVSKEKIYGEFSKEFVRIHKYTTQMGKDLITSMKESSKRTPSARFRIFLDGLIAATVSGSDLNTYLEEETKREIDIYRERGKKYTSSMSMFADIFIVVFLIAPLCLMLMFAVFSTIDSTFLGISLEKLAQGLVYVFVPVLGIMYLSLLGTVKP